MASPWWGLLPPRLFILCLSRPDPSLTLRRQQLSFLQTRLNSIQRFRIGQCVAVVDAGRTVDQACYGEFYFFAAAGVGDVWHRDDMARNMTGAGAFADLGFQ